MDTTRRQRGRPKLSDQPIERVCVRLPRPMYDDLAIVSIRKRESMSSLLREAVTRILSAENGQAPPSGAS